MDSASYQIGKLGSLRSFFFLSDPWFKFITKSGTLATLFIHNVISALVTMLRLRLSMHLWTTIPR